MSQLLLVASAMALALLGAVEELDAATLLVLFAFVAAAGPVLAPAALGRRAVSERTIIDLLSAAIVAELAVFVISPPIRDAVYICALIGVVVIALWTIRYAAARQVVGLLFSVAGIVILMAWYVAVAPDPAIDVHQFQQEGSAALLQGTNPYSIRFTNIYGPDTTFYAPDVMDGNRVTFGYPYPPLGLFMALPGYILAGDYRFAAVAALAGTALFIAFAQRSRIAVAAAFMLVLSPTSWLVVYKGWSEPFVAVIFAGAIYAAVRGPRTAPIAIGLLILTKQYLAPLWLIALILFQGVRQQVGWWVLGIAPMIVAAVPVVPFLVWDWNSFVYSTVTFHGLQPFREDALSLAAMAARAGLEQLPTWLSFALAGVVLVAGLVRAPPTASGFAATTAIVLLAFFLLGKQAFINYYFVVLTALLCSLALSSMPSNQRVPS